MTKLLRKTTQSTYTFEIEGDLETYYIASLTYNDKTGTLVHSSVSLFGEEVDEDKKEEMVDKLLSEFKTELPQPKPLAKRPSRLDDSVRAAAAKKLAPEVLRWAKSAGDDLLLLEDVEADLTKVLGYSTNGYELAKDLEDSHYSPNTELVEILDNAFVHLRQAHTEACIQWLENNPMPSPEIGSQVTHSKTPDAGIGTIVSNSPEGKSTVRFPALGHVDKGNNGSHGLILPWEELDRATR